MMAQAESGKRVSIEELETWEGSWEIINGVPYNMTPAPATIHQKIVGELHFSLRSHFGKDGCEVFVAPFDVQLDTEDEYTLVQPDISVFCKKNVSVRKEP